MDPSLHFISLSNQPSESSTEHAALESTILNLSHIAHNPPTYYSITYILTLYKKVQSEKFQKFSVPK